MRRSSADRIRTRRLVLVAVLIAAAVAGFTFGRVSGTGRIGIVGEKREFPTPPPPPRPDEKKPAAPQPEKNIVLEVPSDGAVLGETFEVSGRARAFENTVRVVVKDADGKPLVDTFTTADGETGQFGRFRANIAMPAGVSGPGAIEVFWESPEDGSRLDVVTRAVTFAPKDTVAVQVYWGNSVLDPEAACSAVFAASRFVPSRTQIYRAVLEELLRGPTAEEKERGYFTSVPHGARVRSVAADERGVVRADFTEELGRVAGSCRVIAIRAQIERTLAQFPEVRDVVISVNGRTEDILQP